MYKKLLYPLILIFAIISCGPSGSNEEGMDETLDSVQQNPESLEITKETMKEIVDNIASPVEMAALIKQAGVPFSIQYLCSTENPDRFDTNFKKAIGLGFMGADLGYLNIYERTSQVVGYVTVIKKLADGLKVGQFFDFNTLKRLATNNENLDSLMFISVNSFNQMDSYLRGNNRSDLSALIITGVWIEGMYLATQVVKEKPNNTIKERIGEQKNILEQLMIILKNYKGQKNFDELIADFAPIQSSFEPVKISYVVGEPQSKEVNGKLVIVQNETSVVEVSNDQLNKIISAVETLRNRLVNPK